MDLSAISSKIGDESKADISAKWEFGRFEGLITRNPHRPRFKIYAAAAKERRKPSNEFRIDPGMSPTWRPKALELVDRNFLVNW